MKKIISFFILVSLLFGCNNDLVKKPDNLIDKKTMEDIFYEMSLLDASRYQFSSELYANGINPKTYIYKKYKIDSVQFAKSNTYYAADYREYKGMFDRINDRLKKEKEAVDSVLKKVEKKETARNKAKAKKVLDSIKVVQKKKELKAKKEKDSIAKAEKAKVLNAKK